MRALNGHVVESQTHTPSSRGLGESMKERESTKKSKGCHDDLLVTVVGL